MIEQEYRAAEQEHRAANPERWAAFDVKEAAWWAEVVALADADPDAAADILCSPPSSPIEEDQDAYDLVNGGDDDDHDAAGCGCGCGCSA